MKREIERRRVVGLRRIWGGCKVWVTRLVLKSKWKGGKGGREGRELRDGVRLERMHTVRRLRQRDMVETKKRILREIERVKGEPEDDSSDYIGGGDKKVENGEFDVEAQRPQTSRSTRIKALQDQLHKLEHSSTNTDPNIQKPLPTTPPLPRASSSEQRPVSYSGSTAFDSTSIRCSYGRGQNTFTHPGLTNSTFNTPDSSTPLPRHLRQTLYPPTPLPRRNRDTVMSTSTWQYNDSASENEEGEGGDRPDLFSLFVTRARQFEAGEAYPGHVGVTDFSRPGRPLREGLNGSVIQGRQVGGNNRGMGRQGEGGNVIERPGAAYLPRGAVGSNGTFLIGDSEEELEAED